jgi:hypothetical protein
MPDACISPPENSGLPEVKQGLCHLEVIEISKKVRNKSKICPTKPGKKRLPTWEKYAV